MPYHQLIKRFAVENPDVRQTFRDYWEVYSKAADQVEKELMSKCEKIPELAPILAAMGPAALGKENAASRERTRHAIMDGQWEGYLADLHAQGMHYARMGVPLAAWMELVTALRALMRPILFKAYAADSTRLLSSLDGLNALMDMGVAGIGEAYMTASAEIIRAQQHAIRELSTPVLRVRDRLLILAIVGIVDTQRARQITEELLKAVRQHRARAVVMDITGVPLVDSKVASHLVQTVEAARLMGATSIITGISPEIAQTLVTLGAELPDIKTFGDLQGGMEEAEMLLGYRVTLAAKGAA